MKNKFAFTLAETLVVIGIIGVVAALTLPNLNSSTGEKEKVVKLQKVYSNLQEAFGRAEITYGPYRGWCTGLSGNDCDKRIFERITEFMKVTKVCTVNDACTLFNSGDSFSDGDRASYAAILADGTTIGIYNGGYSILIDLDGVDKGPNADGKDYFYLNITEDEHSRRKILTYGSRYQIKNNYELNKFNSNTYNASELTAWVLVNGNMEYLKTGISGKCPDGKKLQFGVKTSCK